MKWAFWVSLLLIVYTYAGYPLWLYLRSLWRPRPVHAGPVLPSVSILLVVHNEAEVLAEKLQNLADLDYPSDRYEIVVVSDGSADATNQILATSTQEHLRALILPEHIGKASALNRAIEAAQGDILVFVDARQALEPGAIRHLVANFADSSVGCVSGELILGEPREGASQVAGVGLYWRIEKRIRQWEGATGSVMGVTGALYAVRKNLVVPLPAGTILDDVYLPLQVIRQGARVVFESRARAWDRLSATPRQEFRRKVRTLTGNYQLLQLAPWLLTPRNPVLFEFVSHKLLRLAVPFAAAAVFVSSLCLEGPLYRAAGVAQLVFYSLAALASFQPQLRWVTRLGNAPLAFVLLNAAAAVALINFLTKKRPEWTR